MRTSGRASVVIVLFALRRPVRLTPMLREQAAASTAVLVEDVADRAGAAELHVDALDRANHARVPKADIADLLRHDLNRRDGAWKSPRMVAGKSARRRRWSQW